MAVSIKGTCHTSEGRGVVPGWGATQGQVPRIVLLLTLSMPAKPPLALTQKMLMMMIATQRVVSELGFEPRPV